MQFVDIRILVRNLKQKKLRINITKPQSAEFRSTCTRMTVRESPCKISCSHRRFKIIVPHT